MNRCLSCFVSHRLSNDEPQDRRYQVGKEGKYDRCVESGLSLIVVIGVCNFESAWRGRYIF